MSDSPNRDVETFSEALALPASERAAYLERACVGDPAMRERVERLLRAHETAGDFLSQAPSESPVRGESLSPIGEKPGDRIGRYKLLQQIGEGGCGVVFMADQEAPVRRQVALKVIKPGMDTKSVIARFEAERQALALMDHPNIAKVLDAGTTEAGRPYFVMELVRGIKITDFCDQHSLPTHARLDLFVQVCHAVQHAHQKGIIHRDLKPSNILVTTIEDGSPLPKVIDFGIAKATTGQRLTDKTVFTAFEMLVGTPAYMSPEQAAMTNVEVDTRTDIYGLGVLLYELLTGTTPFDACEILKAGLDEVRRVIIHQEPVRPSTRLSTMLAADLTTVAQRRQAEPPKLIRSVRGDLDWIVIKALEKDRTRRYATANGLAEDVRRCLSNQAITARPPSAWYRFSKLVSRNKLLFGAAGAIAMLLVVSLVLVTASLRREQRSRREAETEAFRSSQTTRFLKDMLQGVGPSVALGQDTAMLKGILDKTAECVGREMVHQPVVEADLRGLIGRLYLEIGTYDKAEEMFSAALALQRKLYGSESAETAASLNDLGSAFWKERKLDEAQAAHEEALRIRRRLFGQVHADVATSLNSLGAVYRRQRKLREAEALTREALEMRQKLFGNDHLDVAESLRNLGIILGDTGKRVEAEAMSQAVLEMRRRLLGSNDTLVAGALVDAAWAAAQNGRMDVAESLQTEALVMQRTLLGDEHPSVTTSLAAIGGLIRQQGKLSESHAVLNAALSIQRKLLGENHAAFFDTLQSLGWTLDQEGKWAEAEAVHREALGLLRKRGGEDDSRAREELERLVRALLGQTKFGEAERVLNEALTPTMLRQPSSLPLVTLRLELYGRRGRWAEAVGDATILVELNPSEHYHYHALAPLLAITHNLPAYEQLCRKFVERFNQTKNPYVAERLVKSYLLVPSSGADLRVAERLADSAIAPGGGEPENAYFQTAKALSSYRLGRFREAIEWGVKPLTTRHALAAAQGCAIGAMGYWQLGRHGEARAMLAKGNRLAPDLQPVQEHEEIGGAWVAWLFARIALTEAAALIDPGSPTQNDVQAAPGDQDR